MRCNLSTLPWLFLVVSCVGQVADYDSGNNDGLGVANEDDAALGGENGVGDEGLKVSASYPVVRCTQAMLAAATYGDSMQLQASLAVEPVYCVNTDGRTPLHMAAQSNRMEAALILLQEGALMSRDRWGRTPLHDSAMSGHKDMTSLLLDSNAYVELEDQVKRRPLHYAARYGHMSVVKLLLGRGAGVEAQDMDGRRAIHHSSQLDKYINISQYLIEEAQAAVSPTDKVKFTPLHFACFEGQIETVKLLISHKSDPFARDEAGWTPLIYAASNRFLHVSDWLVFDILKPKSYALPDPENFIQQNPSTLMFGFPAWLFAIIASLGLTCMIVVPMFRMFKRTSNLATPYKCEASDEELEDFVNEVFDLALAQGGKKMKLLGKEWDSVPAHTLSDLHRKKDR